MLLLPLSVIGVCPGPLTVSTVSFIRCPPLFPSPTPSLFPSLSLYWSQFDRLTALAKLLFGTNFFSYKTLFNTASPLPFPLTSPSLPLSFSWWFASVNQSFNQSFNSISQHFFNLYAINKHKFLFAPPQKYVSLADTQWNVLPLACSTSLSLPPTHFPLLPVSRCKFTGCLCLCFVCVII